MSDIRTDKDGKITYAINVENGVESAKPMFITIPYEDYKTSQLQELNLILSNMKSCRELSFTELPLLTKTGLKMYQTLGKWLEENKDD